MSSQTTASSSGKGLTTTKAPFVEEAHNRGDLFITQPYEMYSEENQQAWRTLYARIRERWEKYANEWFLQGLSALHLNPNAIPRLEEINTFLKPLTGFQAKPVSGYVPILLFFDCLRRREFPTTITIRDINSLDYLPEPDIFHDVAGHVPMHTNRAFADTLVRFGNCAFQVLEMVADIKEEAERIRRVTSMLRAMRRFFWFTIETGLMRGKDGLKVYGSGILSSRGEIEHAIESPEVQRYPIQLEWVINQGYEIHHYQPLLFIVDSFDHLFDLVGELERWMHDNRLNNVAPGLPHMSEEDVRRLLADADG